MKLILRHFDIRLFLSVLALAVFGIVMISSVTEVNVYGMSQEVKIQSLSLFLGLIFMGVSLLFDYKILGRFYIAIYILSILFLLIVYIPGIGVVRNEARSWIELGP